MLHLPAVLEVQLGTADGRPAGAVLVAMDVLHEGRYYYGTVRGLTDANGVVRATVADVADGFREDQHLFPMDYRVRLEDCDPIVRVRIEGGLEFVARRDDPVGEGLTIEPYREWWQRAANAAFASAAQEISVNEEPVTIHIELRPSGIGTSAA